MVYSYLNNQFNRMIPAIQPGKTIAASAILEVEASYSVFNDAAEIRLTATCKGDILSCSQTFEYLVPIGTNKIRFPNMYKPGTTFTIEVKDTTGTGYVGLTFRMIETSL